jgi:hypothetical protein
MNLLSAISDVVGVGMDAPTTRRAANGRVSRKHGEKKETLCDKEANRLRLLQWKLSPSLSRALTMYSNTSSYPDAMAGGNSSFGQLEVS